MKQGKKALSLLAVVAFLVMALVPMTALASDITQVTVANDGSAPTIYQPIAANTTVPVQLTLGGTSGTDTLVSATPVTLTVEDASNTALTGGSWAINSSGTTVSGTGGTSASIDGAQVTIPAGADGAQVLKLNYTVPTNAATGTYTIKATGFTTNSGSATFTVAATPTLTVSAPATVAASDSCDAPDGVVPTISGTTTAGAEQKVLWKVVSATQNPETNAAFWTDATAATITAGPPNTWSIAAGTIPNITADQKVYLTIGTKPAATATQLNGAPVRVITINYVEATVPSVTYEDSSPLTVVMGAPITIKATASGLDGEAVAWTSTTPSIGTVSDGTETVGGNEDAALEVTFTPVAVGSTTVRATIDGNNYDLAVNVVAADASVISVAPETVEVTAGEDAQTLKVTVLNPPTGASQITWTFNPPLSGANEDAVTLTPSPTTVNGAGDYTVSIAARDGAATTNYQLRATLRNAAGDVLKDENDADLTDTVTVNVVAAPAAFTISPASTAAKPISALPKSNVTLTGSASGVGDTSGMRIRWTVTGGGAKFADGNTSEILPYATAATLVMPDVTEATNVTVTATLLPATGTAPVAGTVQQTAYINVDPNASSEPTDEPTGEPTDQPTDTPTDQPTDQPTQPTATATATPGATPSASVPATNAPTVPAPGASSPVVLPPVTTSTAAPSASPSASPSSSATAVPSGSAAPTPAATAPVQINESAADVPEGLEVEANPSGTGSVITGAPISTPQETNSVSELKGWIAVPEGGSVQVLTASGAPAADNAPMATGMIVRVYDAEGQAIEESTLVVMADVMGTGEISLTQLVNMAAAYMGTRPLEGIYALAADLDGSGSITLTDLVIAARIFREAGLTMGR